VKFKIKDARVSKSKPDTGILFIDIQLRNQRDEFVRVTRSADFISASEIPRVLQAVDMTAHDRCAARFSLARRRPLQA
jgi:hypothetical protein